MFQVRLLNQMLPLQIRLLLNLLKMQQVSGTIPVTQVALEVLVRLVLVELVVVL